MAFGLAVYASPDALPRTTQDSLPAAGQALLDGLSTRRIPMKGFRVASYISSSFPKLLGAITTAEERSSCDRYQFDEPAVLIPLVSSTGHGHASLKRLHFEASRFSLGNILCAAIPVDHSALNARFLYEYLSAFRHELLVSRMSGTANVSLTLSKVADVPVPIVDQRAQRCVIRMVELCDELEEQQAQRRAVRVRLNDAALARLTTAPTPTDFQTAWTRVRTRFGTLYTTPETVQALRQTILQLAVQGKLVPQDPNDEPAGTLLSNVELLRKKLLSGKHIANYRPKEAIDKNSLPSLIPPSWEWAQLGSLISLMDSGWSPKCHEQPTSSPEQWGVLKTTAVQQLRYDVVQHKQLPETLAPRPRHEVQAGDLLITRAGPRQRVGISCAVTETRPRLMISDKIIRFQLLSDEILPEFVILCLNAGVSQEFLETQKSGMAASQMNIPQTKLRRTPIPIAPTNEQQRIVERVEQLMPLCDTLADKLTQQQSDADRLTEAMVEGILNETRNEGEENP